jgi:hypothetical protein
MPFKNGFAQAVFLQNGGGFLNPSLTPALNLALQMGQRYVKLN